MTSSISIAAQESFLAGVNMLQRANYPAARNAFDLALQLAPNYADPLMYRAVLKIHHLDDISGGIADCNAALKLKPGHPMALGNRAIAYLKQARYARAVPDFRGALQVNSLDASLHRMKAYCHYELEQYEDAITHYTMCLKVWHEEALCYDMRGVCYYCRHQFTNALDDFNAALNIQPNNPGTLTNRGLLHAALEAFDAALADHNAALSVRETPTYYSNRGTTYFAMGDYAAAQADCERTLALDPHFGDAYGLRGLLHFVNGQFSEALADFRKMEQYNGVDDAHALIAQSITLYQLEDKPQARAIWTKLVQKYPDLRSTAWLHDEFRLSRPLLPIALQLQQEISG